MAMVINTNIAAINANRTLETTGREMSTAMERLTSGLRINSAADDAAGLGVSTQMDTQIRGTDMAIRNANDGIAKIQTADGAAEEITSMLQRMRELGVQSLNGTYSDANRAQMNEEYKALESEIGRIAETTKFNGVNIMNASASSFSAAGKFHVGWEVGAANKVSMSIYNFAVSAGAMNISALSVGNISAASVAIASLGRVLSEVNLQRASWGAVQNRLESTTVNLANINENIQAAQSQILDTDFAKESANLARTQVLQQAGISMLSQANQQSQQVLSLLQ